MNILLVQPRVNFERTYPLGLAYIAGHLRRHGVEVEGFDGRVGGARGLAATLARRRFDLVGISAYTSNLEAALHAAAEVRRRQPRALCVIGGPHATLVGQVGPQDLWDYLVRGDGEHALLSLARGDPDAPGIVPAGDPRPAAAYLHPRLEDLDFADREVFPLSDYHTDALKRGRWTAVIASRGCTRDCAYCSASLLGGGHHRRRQVEAVLEELRRLRVDHGVDGVLLEDDNLFLDRAWAVELFEAIGRAGLGLRVELPNGVDPTLIDSDIVSLLARAGVTSISLGVESLIRANQLRLRRPIDPSHMQAVINAARARGVRVAGFFIIGLPADTITGILGMFRDIRRLGLDLAHVSALQQLPGMNLEPPRLGRATLLTLQRLFYLYYYAAPDKVARTLREGGPSPRFVYKMLVRFASWVMR